MYGFCWLNMTYIKYGYPHLEQVTFATPIRRDVLVMSAPAGIGLEFFKSQCKAATLVLNEKEHLMIHRTEGVYLVCTVVNIVSSQHLESS